VAGYSVSWRAKRAPTILLTVALVWSIITPPAGLAQPSYPPGSFPDTAGHWAEACISLLSAKGVVSGFSDGLFRPEDGLTRGQFAKLAVAGLEGTATASLLHPFPAVFADLRGHWARGWVAAARELDLVRGYDADRFGPDDSMTRAQVAAVLVRALGWDEEAAQLAASGQAAALLEPFGDFLSVPDWAAGYLALAVARGLLRGYSDNTLRPEAGVTRAESATLLARALDLLSLAFDLGGELVEVDQSGRIQLGRIWGWPEGAPQPSSVSLATSASTACFRNGAATQLADLVPGDWLLVVLSGRAAASGGAEALFVQALSWDLLGTLAAVDLEHPSGAVCSVETGDRTVDVTCGAATEVFRHGWPSEARDLLAGDRVYVLLDPLTGRALIVDAVRPDVSGVILETGPESGRQRVVVRPGLDSTGDREPVAPPVIAYVPPGAFVSIDGYPASPGSLSPGLNVVLAELDPRTAEAGYCEAWWPQSAGPGSGTSPALSAPGLSAASRAAADLPAPGLPAAVSSAREEGVEPLVPFPRSGLLAIAPAATRTEVLGQVGISVAATGAAELRAATGADGDGVTLAIVDTGVDPGHPALKAGPDGQVKIVDWTDFTGEGRVMVSSSSPSYLGVVATPLGGVTLGRWTSRSGVYRSGLVDEALLGPVGGDGVDLDGNGSSDDRYALVLVDSHEPGRYDLLLVDTDRDLDLADETAVAEFRPGDGTLRFGVSDDPAGQGASGLSVVVCSLDGSGFYVELGFDANGHGTHVAAVAAGHDGDLPGIQVGMAPAARIMSLKALGSDGSGDWRAISEAVAYAGENGADAVVLAVESPGKPYQGAVDAYEQVAALAGEYRIPVFVAAGNGGPGLMTVLSAPQDELLVPVGGFISKEMWSGIYGQEMEEGSLWLYGASGPGPNGLAAPLLIAPAAAVSAVPAAVDPEGYLLFEGTSMAAPHAAGAAALLIQLARLEGAAPDPVAVVRCLAAGARPLQGVSPAEQGFGVLDVSAAARYLASFDGSGELVMSLVAEPGDAGCRWELPDCAYGSWPVSVFSPMGPMLEAELLSRYGLIVPDRHLLYVPGGLDRGVTLAFAGDLAPGSEDLSDLILASEPVTGEPLGGLVAHVTAAPAVLPADGTALRLAGECPRAAFDRRYFCVPEGASSLRVEFAAGSGPAGRPRGLLRGFVYAPGGYLLAETGLVGSGAAPARSVEVLNPPPGVWELVAWGAPQFGAPGDKSLYQWEVAGEVLGLTVDPSRLDFPAGPAPGSITVNVELDLPGTSDELLVGAVGWTGGARGYAPWRALVQVPPDGAVLWELPEVPRGLGLLEVSAVGLSPVDADVYLYRLEPSGPGSGDSRWVEVGRSVRRGEDAELVTIWDPLPGEYAAVVDAPGSMDFADVALEARRWSTGWALLDEVGVEQGAAGRVFLELELPGPVGSGGEYLADIVVRSASSLRVVVTAPLVVTTGVPELLCLVAPSLGRGLAGDAAPPPVARILRADDMLPASAEIAAGGRIIRADEGTAVLSRVSTGELAVPGRTLEVAVTAGGYRPWSGALLPAGPAGGSPLPGDVGGLPPFARADGEPPGLREALRRKCIWQSRG